VSHALYLIDTSGLFRILQDKLRQAWADQLAAGVIAICPVVELEFLYSARSLADRLEKRRLLREVFGWVAMSDRAYERADEVQQLLTETGRHRSAGPVGLLIAATAEREAPSSCATTAISRRWPQLPASQSSSSPVCSRARSQGRYDLLTAARQGPVDAVAGRTGTPARRWTSVRPGVFPGSTEVSGCDDRVVPRKAGLWRAQWLM